METPPPIPGELWPENRNINKSEIHSKAMASFICGLAGLLITPLAFAAVVLGHIAKSDLRQDESLRGKNYAIAGLVFGYLVTGVVAACFISMPVMYFWPQKNKASKELTDSLSFLAVDSGINEDITAIIFNGETFIAALRYGRLMTSENGTEWRVNEREIGYGVDALVHGDGKTIAVSGNSLFIYDGSLHWNEMDAKLPETIADLIWTGKAFVGAVDKGMLVSRDGLEWDKRLIPGIDGVPSVSGDESMITAEYYGVLKVKYTGGKWETIENGYHELATVWKGEIWAARFSETSLYTYRDSKWVHVLSPPVGGMFSFASTEKLTVTDSYLLAFGDHFSWSLDGRNWGSFELPYEYDSSFMRGMTYGNGRFILAGDDGMLYIGANVDNISTLQDEINHLSLRQKKSD